MLCFAALSRLQEGFLKAWAGSALWNDKPWSSEVVGSLTSCVSGGGWGVAQRYFMGKWKAFCTYRTLMPFLIKAQICRDKTTALETETGTDFWITYNSAVLVVLFPISCAQMYLQPALSTTNGNDGIFFPCISQPLLPFFNPIASLLKCYPVCSRVSKDTRLRLWHNCILSPCVPKPEEFTTQKANGMHDFRASPSGHDFITFTL